MQVMDCVIFLHLSAQSLSRHSTAPTVESKKDQAGLDSETRAIWIPRSSRGMTMKEAGVTRA